MSQHSWLTENNLNLTMVDLLDQRTCISIYIYTYIYPEKNNQANPRSGTYTSPPGYTAQCCHVTTQPSRKPRTAHVGCSSPYWSKRASKNRRIPGHCDSDVICLSVRDGRFQFGIHPSTKNRMRISKSTCEKNCLLQYWDPCFYKTRKE